MRGTHAHWHARTAWLPCTGLDGQEYSQAAPGCISSVSKGQQKISARRNHASALCPSSPFSTLISRPHLLCLQLSLQAGNLWWLGHFIKTGSRRAIWTVSVQRWACGSHTQGYGLDLGIRFLQSLAQPVMVLVGRTDVMDRQRREPVEPLKVCVQYSEETHRVLPALKHNTKLPYKTCFENQWP